VKFVGLEDRIDAISSEEVALGVKVQNYRAGYREHDTAPFIFCLWFAHHTSGKCVVIPVSIGVLAE